MIETTLMGASDALHAQFDTYIAGATLLPNEGLSIEVLFGDYFGKRAPFEGNEKISDLVKRNEELIKSEVLADRAEYDSVKGFTKEWNINGESVTIGVEKLS